MKNYPKILKILAVPNIRHKIHYFGEKYGKSVKRVSENMR